MAGRLWPRRCSVSGGARGYIADLGVGLLASRCASCPLATLPMGWGPARSTSACPARTCCVNGAICAAPGRPGCCRQRWASARADLVAAVPKSYLDVATITDPREEADDYLARTGRRLRVATKYLTQTRAFFMPATGEWWTTGSPSSAARRRAARRRPGAAELIVDITTTGATLAANGLKILADGLILKSQAQLTASLKAAWSADQLAVAERLLRAVEGRAPRPRPTNWSLALAGPAATPPRPRRWRPPAAAGALAPPAWADDRNETAPREPPAAQPLRLQEGLGPGLHRRPSRTSPSRWAGPKPRLALNNGFSLTCRRQNETYFSGGSRKLMAYHAVLRPCGRTLTSGHQIALSSALRDTKA